jgi:hypothetical protein
LKTPTPMLASLASTLPTREREKKVPPVIKYDCSVLQARERVAIADLPTDDLKNDPISRSIAENGNIGGGELHCVKVYWRR